MKLKMTSLAGKKVGDIELAEDIYGLEPREDILQRVVRWQLAKRQSGNHKTKNRSEIRATGKKMYRQKGTGGARHGSKKVGIFRGGGKSFGPVVRSHAFDLPKKVRVLGLKHALSAKVKSENLLVIDKASSEDGKTKTLLAQLQKMGLSKALIVDMEPDEKFSQALRNIPEMDVLPAKGANVYDILRSHKLVLTKDAVETLQERLG